MKRNKPLRSKKPETRHAPRICPVCFVEYTPGDRETDQQAAKRKTCSAACAGLLRSKAMTERRRQKRLTGVSDEEACRCSACKDGRAASAARQAHLPPRKRWSPAQWQARLDLIRQARKKQSVSVWE